MSRSVWKGPFFDGYLLKKVQKMQQENKIRPIKTWSRRSVIIPQFIGFTFEVHNGKKFIPVCVSEDMIGKKLGEFAPTRIFKGHSGNKKAVRK